MKAISMLSTVALVLSGWMTSFGQAVESEVPGDNFSLEGALELFKKSESPEDFERMLNSPDTKVNNLDLNGDGYIDYIRVYDRYEGNVHVFIIQAVISERELQDVAIIELEKLSNGKAVLQIVGDEDIYGIETIIEPTTEVRTYAGTTSSRTIVNVWAWPSVQYIYSPYYTVWVSPWGWHRRPLWWHSWRPIAYVHYYPIWRPYYRYYAPCYTRRIVYADHIYYPHRSTSVIVRHRHRDQVERYRTNYHDGDRNDRVRNTDHQPTGRNRGRELNESRRTDSYTNRRTDSDVNRSSLNPQRETVTPTWGRTAEDRTVSREPKREFNQIRKGDAPNRTTTLPENRVQRERAVNPAVVNRSRTAASPQVQQQRSAISDRSVRQEMQRTSPELKRQSYPENRSRDISNYSRQAQQPTRAPSVDRGRSSGNQGGQQRQSSRPAPTKSSEIKRGRH